MEFIAYWLLPRSVGVHTNVTMRDVNGIHQRSSADQPDERPAV
jgi:hypothetical protein